MIFQNIPPTPLEIVLQAKGFWDEYLQVHHFKDDTHVSLVSPFRCAGRPKYFSKRQFMQRKGILEHPQEGVVPAGPSRPNIWRAVPSPDGCHWRPLEIERFKLNIDAAWTVNCAGIGGIIRDHLERVQISFTTALAHSHSPEHAETIAIREGLRLAERFGYTNFTL